MQFWLLFLVWRRSNSGVSTSLNCWPIIRSFCLRSRANYVTSNVDAVTTSAIFSSFVVCASFTIIIHVPTPHVASRQRFPIEPAVWSRLFTSSRGKLIVITSVSTSG